MKVGIRFFHWILICVHFHRHEIMLADLPTEIDNYHELCPLKPVPTNPMHKSQLLGYPTSTYKATNTKTGVRYCLRRVHGEDYCWKKYNSRNMKVYKTLETIVCLYATFIPYLPEYKLALIKVTLPPNKTPLPRRKCIDPNLGSPPKNKMFTKKKYFTVNFIHLIYKACQILSTFTNQCHFLHLHIQCLHLPHTHSNIPILFTAIPQLIIIHCFGYTALLKTLPSHFWWDVLPCCYHPHWLNNTFVFHGLSVALHPWRFTVFCTDGVGCVEFQIRVFWIFVLCRWYVQSEFMALLMVINLWIAPCFMFESCN